MKKYLLDTNICIFSMRDKYSVNERLENIRLLFATVLQCYS